MTHTEFKQRTYHLEECHVHVSPILMKINSAAWWMMCNRPWQQINKQWPAAQILHKVNSLQFVCNVFDSGFIYFHTFSLIN